jgi:hypothetical protein
MEGRCRRGDLLALPCKGELLLSKLIGIISFASNIDDDFCPSFPFIILNYSIAKKLENLQVGISQATIHAQAMQCTDTARAMRNSKPKLFGVDRVLTSKQNDL